MNGRIDRRSMMATIKKTTKQIGLVKRTIPLPYDNTLGNSMVGLMDYIGKDIFETQIDSTLG
jgi:hypothetical protein